jgi:hypothetical protein
MKLLRMITIVFILACTILTQVYDGLNDVYLISSNEEILQNFNNVVVEAKTNSDSFPYLTIYRNVVKAPRYTSPPINKINLFFMYNHSDKHCGNKNKFFIIFENKQDNNLLKGIICTAEDETVLETKENRIKTLLPILKDWERDTPAVNCVRFRERVVVQRRLRKY